MILELLNRVPPELIYQRLTSLYDIIFLLSKRTVFERLGILLPSFQSLPIRKTMLVESLRSPAVEIEKNSISLSFFDNTGIEVDGERLTVLPDSQRLEPDLLERATILPARSISLPVYLGARPFEEVMEEKWEELGYGDEITDLTSRALNTFRGTLIGAFSGDEGGEYVFINTPYLVRHSSVKGGQSREEVIGFKIAESWLHESTHLLQTLDPERKNQMDDDVKMGGYFVIASGGGYMILYPLITQPWKVTRRKFLLRSMWALGGIVSIPLAAKAGYLAHYLVLNRTEAEARGAEKKALELQDAFLVLRE